MSVDPSTVFIVDDDQDLRAGLAYYLRSVGGFSVDEHGSAESFLAAHEPSLSGCLLTDLRLPRMDGVSLVATLNRMGTQLPALVMSGFAQTDLVVAALRAGAIDFLEKPLDPPTVLRAVRAALLSGATVARLRSEAATAAERLNSLSPRERDVLTSFATGAMTKQVAGMLQISPKTVETYRLRLFGKLQVSSQSALVRMAMLTTIFSSLSENDRGRSR
jgi:two-component system, LuxR family, response regulator FixJ